jgi:hypothetical protein
VAVEFAFIGVLLVVMMYGLLDLARVGFTLQQLDRAASETARFAAVHTPTPSRRTRPLVAKPARVPESHAVWARRRGPFLPTAPMSRQPVEIEHTYNFAFTPGPLRSSTRAPPPNGVPILN